MDVICSALYLCIARYTSILILFPEDRVQQPEQQEALHCSQSNDIHTLPMTYWVNSDMTESDKSNHNFFKLKNIKKILKREQKEGSEKGRTAKESHAH